MKQLDGWPTLTSDRLRSTHVSFATMTQPRHDCCVGILAQWANPTITTMSGWARQGRLHKSVMWADLSYLALLG